MAVHRDAFLRRVRAALAAGGPAAGAEAGPPARPAGTVGLPRADHPGSDPAAWPERFGRELEAVGGTWARVAARPEAVAEHLEEQARRHGLRAAVSWDPEAVAGEEGAWLAAALAGLRRAGCAVDVLGAAGVDAAGATVRARARAAADAGVVVAEAAVASSGSALLVHGPGRPRLVSLLPERLLILVPVARLRPTLDAALADLVTVLRAGAPVQQAALVTGPSKSADIELELVTGVHGPRWVHAVVVG